MSTETNPNPAPAPAPNPAPAPAPSPAPAPAPSDANGNMMAQLVARERELETSKRELEQLRAKTKQFERDARKSTVLGALYTEFPGLPAAEVRGVALVAADDGVVDLYGDDTKVAIEKLKELLAARSKVAPTKPAPTAPPTQTLGGTPGTPGVGPTARAGRLPI
jgi:hypothetical protein